ncbi:dihydroneopterin aldolase [Helicobacter heilmannii]|uniref:Dihydroneopterin aldolase n=1 Tax=Helicobacter heilmannii TaxID=35817 RepID=A0A0K2YAW4_HELHE|nr:dihydroneopterin aldolase [Helicobacter heilmannii]CCM11427.1 Dihydroneopterin aldolase [Helicobacter heilmannii ASB1.4]CRF45410.1 Dihydroneopterin aldolase [Helicobacter heilmannii]CRF49078.1 Dihydroneopterin aldolase [Helicobacter heilmannii]CRF51020.1 Dihydroneopterin aldolase [Helicobacter heilmannii]CRI34849.1 Dihydroneopterin aldolase [Helicobacter heilmannii]
MTLSVQDYQIDAIIGVLESEQKTPQPLIVDLSIEYNYTPQNCLDYMDILEVVQNKLSTTKYGLLEEALSEISTWLKTCFPIITQVYMSIKKPQACQRALVGASLRVCFDENKGS